MTGARRAALCLPLLALAAAAPPRRETYGPPPPPTPYDLCESAIADARPRAMPPTLLGAIARVESGRLDPTTGRVRPWPWTINVDGQGRFFETKEDAVAAVEELQKAGKRVIDVGCMQVNLFYHPNAYPTLDAAFDPPTNTAYAARYLLSLYAASKDWSLATAWYHSQTQEFGEDYQRRVFGRVMTPMGPAKPAPGSPLIQFGAFAPPSTIFGALPQPGTQFGAFAPLPGPALTTLPALPARRR